jgi:hypothetical protein
VGEELGGCRCGDGGEIGVFAVDVVKKTIPSGENNYKLLNWRFFMGLAGNYLIEGIEKKIDEIGKLAEEYVEEVFETAGVDFPDMNEVGIEAKKRFFEKTGRSIESIGGDLEKLNFDNPDVKIFFEIFGELAARDVLIAIKEKNVNFEEKMYDISDAIDIALEKFDDFDDVEQDIALLTTEERSQSGLIEKIMSIKMLIGMMKAIKDRC